jgi:hypothetical protein
VLPEDIRRKRRNHGNGHGETLLSHLREKPSSPFLG